MSSYKTILKTTGLFAGLRVLSILVNVGVSKLIAIFIGVSGIGLYGVFTNALTLLSTVSDLGISKSSVRNIAKTESEGDVHRLHHDISLISKLIYITGFIGCVVTIIFSVYLSKVTFGSDSFWLSFVLLGLAVLFTVIKEGQSSIFQGLRKYRLIAKNTVTISLLSFLFSVPLLWYFKGDGIVITILVTAMIGAIVTRLSLSSLDYKKADVKLSYEGSSDLIKLGLSMMLLSLFVSLSGYILRSYIGIVGSIEMTGYFQAGFQIISGYFGLIFTAMSTDFFPRISAVADNNKKLEEEVNQQTIMSLLLVCPLIVILPFIMPVLIKILYSEGFEMTVAYVNIALFGVIFQCGSQTMGMVLLAKNNSKVFVVSVFVFQAVFLGLNIVGFNLGGILGLGITFSVNMLLHLIGIQYINKYLYSIVYSKQVIKYIVIVVLFAITSFLCNRFCENNVIRWLLLFLILSTSIIFVFYNLKRLLNISTIKEIFKRNKL